MHIVQTYIALSPSMCHFVLTDEVEKGRLLVVFIQERHWELETLVFSFHPVNGSRDEKKKKTGLPV